MQHDAISKLYGLSKSEEYWLQAGVSLGEFLTGAPSKYFQLKRSLKSKLYKYFTGPIALKSKSH